MSEQKPSVGRIVHYELTDADADLIGQQVPLCNTHHAGDVLPALMVRLWDGGLVNLQVFADGNGSYWATSRREGDEPGTWRWPPRV